MSPRRASIIGRSSAAALIRNAADRDRLEERLRASRRGTNHDGVRARLLHRSTRPAADLLRLAALGAERWTFRTRHRVASAIAAGLVVLSGGAGIAVERDRGAQLAAVCASCHRLDGRDHGIPSIVGLDAATLVAMMQAFRSGERASQIMQVMSLALTAEDLSVVARYLAAQRKDTGSP